MVLKVLHNGDCSKSRAILEYLDENEVQFEVIDIINDPLTVQELEALLKKLNLTVNDIIRKNDKFFKENFANKNLTDEDLLKVLSENPSLLQRPILIKGSVAMIGRPLENVKFFIDK